MSLASKLKPDFPILSRKIHDHRLVYLDNSATSQKPKQVIEAISNYYQTHNANVHRGVHTLSDESTQVWVDSKNVVARFFGVDANQLILTRNATESLNGVAYGWAYHHIHEGDVIISSLMEHHANLVVWQEVAKAKKAQLQLIKVTDNGELDLDHLSQLLALSKVKLVAVSHVSNTLGTINPIVEISQMVRAKQPAAVLVVDGAQAAGHIPVNVNNLDVDFYAFSGHKMLAPMGIGGLIVGKKMLAANEFKPWYFGGGMIESVGEQEATFHPDFSERFTPGTPDVASAVGLAQACEYLEDQAGGMPAIFEHHQQLTKYALDKIVHIDGLEIIGPKEASKRSGLVAFVLSNIHAHDVAAILDRQGVAVRSGHHCTMPLHTHFGWVATTRASWHVYNDEADIDALVDGLKEVRKVFKHD